MFRIHKFLCLPNPDFGSGSFHHQAKKNIKTLISTTTFVTFYDPSSVSVKNDLNIPSKRVIRKKFCCWLGILKVSDKKSRIRSHIRIRCSEVRIRESGCGFVQMLIFAYIFLSMLYSWYLAFFGFTRAKKYFLLNQSLRFLTSVCELHNEVKALG